MEMYIKIIGCLGVIVTFIVAYFTKEHKKCDELENSYFEKILVPYMKVRNNNSNMNVVRYMKRNCDLEMHFIPPYIFKLIKEGREDDLKGVLCYDYITIFPNNVNVIRRTLRNVLNICNLYVIVIIICTAIIPIASISICCGMIISYLSDFLFKNKNLNVLSEEALWLVIILVFMIVIVLVIYIFRKNIINCSLKTDYDNYVFNYDGIEKIINEKKEKIKNLKLDLYDLYK